MPKSNFLLIDTDPGSRAQLKSMIEAWGYHVVAMTDFPRSLGWFTQHLPPYVILDADIPGASKFTSEIRTLSADVLIIAMASAQRMHLVMENLKHSAEAFLTKPVAPVALEIAVQRVHRTSRLLEAVRQTCRQDRNTRT